MNKRDFFEYQQRQICNLMLIKDEATAAGDLELAKTAQKLLDDIMGESN